MSGGEVGHNTGDSSLDLPAAMAPPDLRELTELQNVLEHIRTYCPLHPDCTQYDPAQGPQGYLSQVRQTNLTENLTTADYRRLGRVNGWTTRLSSEYILQNHACMQELGFSPLAEEARTFLAVNLQYITFTPRALALREYEAARNTILSEHLPGIQTLGANAMQLTDHGVTAEQVQAAKNAIEALPYKAPLPDFYSLKHPVQEEIVAFVEAEWLELCQLVQASSPELLTARSYHTPALAYWSVESLRLAIDSLQSLAPPCDICEAFICEAFLRSPRTFEQALAKLQDENEHKMHELLENPLVNPQVLELLPGNTILVTPKNAVIPADDFDDIVDLHLQLIGRSLYEAQSANPRGVELENWSNLNVGQFFQKSGGLYNLRLTRLPVAKKNLYERNSHPYSDANRSETVASLIIQAERRSTELSTLVSVRMSVVLRTSTAEHDAIYKTYYGDITPTT